jgi:hypothetical protein
VVRHLVGGETGRVAELLRRLVHVRREVLLGQPGELAGGETVAEGGARLDRQLIKRQVIDRHRERLGQFRPPVGQRLKLPRINQVEAHPVEMRARDAEGPPRLRRAVQPSEARQIPVVQRLHAERDAVDPRLGVAAKAPGLHRGRVRLQRHLQIVGEGPGAADAREDRRHEVRVHQARRAAAEKDGVEHAVAGEPAEAIDLGEIGRAPAVLVDPARNVAVKVAIGALRRAEGPVQVEPEAARPPVLDQGRGGGLSQGSGAPDPRRRGRGG